MIRARVLDSESRRTKLSPYALAGDDDARSRSAIGHGEVVGGGGGSSANSGGEQFLFDTESLGPPKGEERKKRTHRPLLLPLPSRQRRGARNLMTCV